ncbi:hypothetical protein QL285_031590 [Trifolium repens]|nr:hypothetical protein QL285_031590 [Trifolium repens]
MPCFNFSGAVGGSVPQVLFVCCSFFSAVSPLFFDMWLLLCLLVFASPDLEVYREPCKSFLGSELSMFFLFFLGCVFLLLYVGLVFTFFRPFSDGGSSVPWCFPVPALDLEVWFGFRSSGIVLGVFLFFGSEVLGVPELR